MLFLIRCNDNSHGPETRDPRSDLGVGAGLLGFPKAGLDQIRGAGCTVKFSSGARTGQEQGNSAKKSGEISIWEGTPRSVTWQ